MQQERMHWELIIDTKGKCDTQEKGAKQKTVDVLSKTPSREMHIKWSCYDDDDDDTGLVDDDHDNNDCDDDEKNSAEREREKCT